jgi:hypothetical protein
MQQLRKLEWWVDGLLELERKLDLRFQDWLSFELQ